MPKHTLIIFSLFIANVSFASELTIPHTFTSGEPALASEVNANFSDTATAVNDNDTRLSALELEVNANSSATATAISDNQARLSSLEAAVTALTASVDSINPSVVGYSKHFATDLIFLRADGTFIIPYTGEPGQQSVPTPDDAVVRNTAYEYNAIPGLDSVSFNVTNDNSLIIFQANGQASVSGFSVSSRVEVALFINGEKPEIGANQRLAIIGDDTLAGDSQGWHIFYTAELDAGSHDFSVMVKVFNQNEDTVSIDGRSTEGFEGRVKVDIIEIKLPD